MTPDILCLHLAIASNAILGASRKNGEQIIGGDNAGLDMYRDGIHGCLVAHLNRGSRVRSFSPSPTLTFPPSLFLSFSAEVGVFSEAMAVALIFVRYWKLSAGIEARPRALLVERS